MAGDWIPVRVHLRDEPEVLQIAEITGRSRHEVIGLLVDLWGWASEVSDDGRILSAFCPQVVRTLSATVGADENFWSAVASVGWLKLDNGIAIPRFDRWLSRGAKRRIKEVQRKRLSRSENKEHNPKNSDRKMSASQADKKRTTGQYSTEHLDTHPTLSLFGTGVCVSSASPTVPEPDPKTNQLEQAWRDILPRVRTHRRNVKDAGGWIHSIRQANPGKLPSEIPGLEDLADTPAKAKSEEDLRREYEEELKHGK
jgi:hypothetical protein